MGRKRESGGRNVKTRCKKTPKKKKKKMEHENERMYE
jgi:hypothetical protein